MMLKLCFADQRICLSTPCNHQSLQTGKIYKTIKYIQMIKFNGVLKLFMCKYIFHLFLLYLFFLQFVYQFVPHQSLLNICSLKIFLVCVSILLILKQISWMFSQLLFCCCDKHIPTKAFNGKRIDSGPQFKGGKITAVGRRENPNAVPSLSSPLYFNFIIDLPTSVTITNITLHRYSQRLDAAS